MSATASSTYRQYKHGTEALLEWLSKSLDELEIAFGRNLGNASIRSEHKFPLPMVSHLSMVDKGRSLADWDLALLGLASQAQKKGASMPFEIRYALEDALKIRRQYHSWYNRQLCQRAYDEDNEHLEQSNEAHAAFIDVLQDIHDLFAPAKAPADQIPSSPSSDRILEISNIFSNLEAGDVAAERPHVPKAKPSADSERPVKSWMSRRSQMLVEDKLLELYCLFDDASKIRGYLRKTWDEYASRKLDVISAAMITQEALELFSEAEKSFEDKYGKIPKDEPMRFHRKHLDIICHLAIGEPMTSTYTSDEFASMSASDIQIEKQKAQSRIEKNRQRFRKSSWKPSEDLDHWLMRPAVCVLDRLLNSNTNRGGVGWILEQACGKPADRATALGALGFDEESDCVPEAAAQELLSTSIDVYAGMIFMQQNRNNFLTPPDIITSQWLGGWDYSIRMTLSMQILHDIRTANSGAGQLNLLSQVFEDYKRLGSDMAVFDKSLYEGTRDPLLNNDMCRRLMDEERSWLQGRAPGQIYQPRKLSKAESQKLSELPLAMNPVLVGMILFGISHSKYDDQISCVNDKWFLIPCAHLLNWLVVRARGQKAALQDLWPDMHTAIGLIGPRPIWLSASPPETPGSCRNRILLAWGLQLNDFYKRILSGDIPNVKELFRKIRNNTNDRVKFTHKELESVFNGEMLPDRVLAKWKSTEGPGHALKVETSQSTPLMDAVSLNLISSNLMKAQQTHIRKIILPPGRSRKSGEELEMLSYLDAFSSTIRAEVPRMFFPYEDVSRVCAILSKAFLSRHDEYLDLPPEMRKCAALKFSRDPKQGYITERLGSGAQSVSSLLALVTMFGERFGDQPVEHLMLEVVENHWDKGMELLSRDQFTKKFVEKCKEFGFAIPECATTALS